MTNPHDILSVAADASEDELRAAYLRKVKEFPPDRSPEQFETIRNAYETLKDPRQRIKARLTSTEFMKPLPMLLDGMKKKRLYAGPKVWLEALRAK